MSLKSLFGYLNGLVILRDLPGNHQTGEIMIVLREWGFEGACSVSSSCWHTADFCHYCMFLVFKATVHLGRGVENGQVKMQQELLFVLRFSSFYWVDTLWIAGSLLLISRVLTKLIFIILPVFSLLLMERIFFDVYSASFFNAISAYVLLIVFQCIHKRILTVRNTVPTL